MRIKVERIYSRIGDQYRLTLPDGERKFIIGNGGKWTRAHSRLALNVLEHIYGVKRRNVRFIHH